MARPLPWSYSALNKFTTCPHQYYETKVLKNFIDAPGEAAIWGTYVHKQIEDLVVEGKTLPDNCQVYRDQVVNTIFERIRPMNTLEETDIQILAEVKLALDTKVEPADWSDRWGGCIIDLLKIERDVAACYDWKTGKVKPSTQLKLNALFVFYHYPQVNTVHTSFEWLNKSVPEWRPNTRDTFTRDQMPAMWNSFMGDLKQYSQAFRTDTWQKRPSGLCKNWCAVTSCEHNGQYSGRNLKNI